MAAALFLDSAKNLSQIALAELCGAALFPVPGKMCEEGVENPGKMCEEAVKKAGKMCERKLKELLREHFLLRRGALQGIINRKLKAIAENIK